MGGLRLMSSFKRLNLDPYPNLLSELNELDLKFKSNQICLNTTVDQTLRSSVQYFLELHLKDCTETSLLSMRWVVFV